MSAHTTSTGSPQSLPDRLLGPVTDRQTYRNLVYVLLRFPLGVAYFTVFLTGLTVGLALTPLLVGIPLLVGVLAGATFAAAFEAHLARELLGVDVSYEPLTPAGDSLVPYAKELVTDVRTYLLVAYFFATFGIGLATFVAVVTLVVLAAVLAVAPLTYWLPFTEYRLFVVDGVGRVAIDTLPEALVASAVGIALFVVALHAFNVLARVLGAVTKTVLS
ncbi:MULTISPECIES: sensor domain-containing protein [Salinibaculum]|uniref:sensor domain-containing protein n=1 Tax=Salinibaculum TaxID=2732368 RepID=UPI0030CBC83C